MIIRKRSLLMVLIGIVVLSLWNMSTISNAGGGENPNPFYYEGWTIGNTQDTNYGTLIKDDAVSPDDSLLNNLMKVFNLDQPDYHWPQKAFYYIRKILNYALWFVSLIALSLLLYSFYGMLVGDEDKQFTKVKSTLKGIAIAIIVMGVARLIVSMLFRIYQNQVYSP